MMEKTHLSFYSVSRKKIPSIEEKNKDFSSFLKDVERGRRESSQHRMLQKRHRQYCAEFYVERKKILPGSLNRAQNLKKSRTSIMNLQSGRNLQISKKYLNEPDYTLEQSDKNRKYSTNYNQTFSRTHIKSTSFKISSAKIHSRSEKWKLRLTEQEKNELCFGKELKMGKQLRMKYTTKEDQVNLRNKLGKYKNGNGELIKKKGQVFAGKQIKRHFNRQKSRNKRKFIDLSNQQNIDI